MKTHILSVLLALLCVTVSTFPVLAQTPSIAGDELCGATAADVCTPADIKTMFSRVMLTFAAVGSALLVVIIVARIVRSWYAYRSGDTQAIKKAGESAFQSLIGFIIVVSVAGGLLMAGLSLLGTQPWATELLRFISFGFIEVGYAQEQLLPNPLGSNSLYDIILSAANLAMRFIIYPAIVFMWVASGFQFVYSQGNPEGLKKARSWLLYAFLITVVAFSLQAFLIAFRGTAERVFGGAGTSQEANSTIPGGQGTSDGRGDPNQANPNAPTSCVGLAQGTVCQVGGRAGTCTTNDEGTYGCYVNTAVPGASCTKPNGGYGRYGTDGICY